MPICVTPYCRKPSAGDRRECWACSKRRYRKRNPVKYAFGNLRDHAKARGIEFTLSFEEFEKFALETEYVTRTGNEAGALTVDRIDNLKGYVPGNIRALTRLENTFKRNHHDEIRQRTGHRWQSTQPEEIDQPF